MEDYREQVKDIMEKIISDNPQLNKVTDKVEARLEQCGWSDEIRMECNRLIRQRGIENISDTTELVRDLTPFARSKVPTELKKELVAMLKDALQKELEGTKLNPK
ncbi:transcription and mRNA export factor ENY2 isoform X4 [Folsomia candida]|uniref:Transcription and mRNA export factor ENY2 n=1 Tax=Folsomia candida TaxID=158441 RepID=A0A226F5U8_FOLCA|nr:transcription and mRNA export factor ENY2 isoform X4 [Folsomia candida]OXA64818.1 Transcription and mRNA export factor ENY2 [Folsomia candida]